MNCALAEPVIVYNPILFQIMLQSGNIQRKRTFNKCLPALFVRNRRKRIAVKIIIILRMCDDILAEIHIFRHREIFRITVFAVYQLT